MPKKKALKKIFEDLEPESSEAPVESTKPESAEAPQETAAQETEQPEAEEANVAEEVSSPAQEPGPEPEAENPDGLLDDVRKSLIEYEAQEQTENQSKWWKRIGRSRKKAEEEEAPKAVEEIDLPSLSAVQPEEIQKEELDEAEDEEYLEQIDELIDLLDTDEEPAEEARGESAVETPVEPLKPVDIAELKKQAFQPRSKETEAERSTDVRSIALEGDEEVFVEVEATKEDPLEERLSAVENALNPYRRYLYFGFAFLGLVMALTAGFLIYNAFQQAQAQAAPTPVVSNLPFPTSVELPGGWSFNLGRGALESGNWNPVGAEWLQGTEICRWVALPYSRQLEAVIRTLNPDDPIELGMSNNDTLVYNVYSIRQMSPQEMQELDSNSPCLLIILAEPGSDQRWVLTALP